jgi:ankyrin repeat protein
MMEYLLQHTAKITTSSKCFGCPLIAAAKNGEYSAVLMLLEHGVTINCAYNPHEALYYACYSGDMKTAGVLLDPRYKASNDLSKLYEHAFKGAIDGRKEDLFMFLSLLMDQGIASPFTEAMFGLAAKSGFSEYIPLALAADFDINSGFALRHSRFVQSHSGFVMRHVIEFAAARGRYQFIQVLLKSGFGRECNENPHLLGRALVCAARYGEEEVVNLLLDEGADINYGGKSFTTGHAFHDFIPGLPLQRACKAGEIRTARLLLARGAHVGASYRSNQILCAACKDGYHDLVSMLVKAGVDPNPPYPFPQMRRRRAYIPLLTALVNGHSMIARVLLQLGALDINPMILKANASEG